jgi:type VI secretion system protein ImpA
MAIIDVDALLAELSPDAPCGEDLAYDPEYMELERLLAPPQEGMVGDEAAEEPNWRDVAKRASALLKRTRDLRLTLYLTISALKREGLTGFRDGLAVLRGMLETFWATVYPQLDPDDDDPIERLNIIASLTMPEASFQDPFQFIKSLHDTPLCSSKAGGSVSLRDIQLSSGELPPPDDPDVVVPEAAAIRGAFENADGEELRATAEAVQQALGHIGAIDAFITARVGADQALNFAEITKLLERMAKEFEAHAAGVVGGAAAEDGAGPEQEGRALAGDIRSTKDVLTAIDKICRYYQANEPSSPVPLLLRRAQRLVSKNFMDIIQDLTPESTHQLQGILGVDLEENAQ